MKPTQGPLLSLFDNGDGTPLQQRLFDRLRAAILDGAIRPGERLPSTRTLAADLGVSRNTVVAAIDRLIAEGYLEARIGSGTFVSRSLPDDAMAPALRLATPRPQKQNLPVMAAGAEILPFRPCVPAYDEFDVENWRRLLAKRWRDTGGLLLGNDTAAGWASLRRVLAGHLQTSRGISCDPEQILILPDRRTALDLAATLLLGAGDTVWLEDPGCNLQHLVFGNRGLHAVPVPMDSDGLDVERAQRLAPDARLALVSPGWQFPLGGTMPLRRRMAMLTWARRTGAWLLEDDRDGGYRYTGRPLPSLMGLDDSERVLHLGSLDQTLVPSLRLAWLVVPPALLGAARSLRNRMDITVPLPEQMAVHDFLAEGHFCSHLRRTRRLYAERQQALLFAAERYWQGMLSLEAAGAGLHLLARLAPGLGIGDTSLSAQAQAARLDVPALSHYRHGPAPAGDPGALLLGYAAFTPERISRAAERLAQVLERAQAQGETRFGGARRLVPAT
ncbi:MULTISPECIES: PLP-dependent aminotransferase family protein [unclassified Azospirillum]|uniref:MocR-like pyridoxine biosynthesis transcription factor PdxR n=1 Tax=unclassified Azospirillum TaxID=2630922 RepID=UPI000B6E5CA5|nr:MULTISPECIES: PLP-dependent aminotransferase family protein [unclassified Azospirillum]SNS89073.1 GntR family transcriptional regulator / MocR family aminotransferase [Azospirillum sp. RU38E]SNT06270.1 GntR family transcriptional regulator / MocR family aminotransferase [Azospirillum sp. RU37A]